jgi:hypothetical protein
LITRIYRELKKLNSPQNNEPINKSATKLNKIFRGKSSNDQKHMKKCSASLAIKGSANQNHTKIPPHSC